MHMKKVYYMTAATIFTIVAIAHLIRAILGVEAVIGGAVIPVWVSWVAAVLAGYLAVRGFQYSRRTWIDRVLRRS